MRTVLIIVALLCLTAPVSAQDYLRGGPAVGVGVAQSREARVNQTRYLGPGFELGGLLELRRGPLTHSAALDFDLGYLSNRLGFANILFGFGVGYTARWDAKPLAGGSFGIVGFLGGGSRFGLYVPEDPEHLAWSTAYELSIGPAWHRRFGPNVFGVTLLGSTYAAVSRPPDRTLRNNDTPNFGGILKLVHSDMRFAGWPDYGSVRAGLSWERRWGTWRSKFRLEGTWQRFELNTKMDLLDYRIVSEFRFGS